MTRTQELRVMREMGRLGGKRRTKTLSAARRWAIARKAGLTRWAKVSPAKRPTASAHDFAGEIQWLSRRRKRYVGKWVALDGDRLIAAGPDAKEVYQAARRAGVEVPFVEKIRPVDKLPFAGW